MHLLSNDLLLTIRERAGGYDKKNEFFTEDFNDLKAAGYLLAGVPEEYSGSGLTLTDLSRAQRVLAMHSPATALGVNMHLLWSAVAGYLHARGDHRLDFIFEEMAAGEVFAFGISEAANPWVLLDSKCTATPQGEDYSISGKKIFTTLSPVWSRLGVHARTSAGTGDREQGKIVIGFLNREDLDDSQISHPDSWNPLGMRATQSYNTLLEDARLRGERVSATFDPFDASDPIIMAVSLCFGVLTSSIYAGIADRAIEIAKDAADFDDPLVATWLSDQVQQHMLSVDSLERLANDVDRLVERDDYSSAVANMKNRVTDEARAAIDVAFRVAGSKAFDADSELSRLYRDVIAGIFHPRSAKSIAAAIRKELSDSQDS